MRNNTVSKQMERQVLREQRLFDALKRITSYQQPEVVRRNATRLGLSEDEALEMAYENVLAEAKNAVRGTRRPNSVVKRNAAHTQTGVSSPKT